MRRSNHQKKQNIRWPLAISLVLILALGFLTFLIFRVFTLDKFIYVNKAKEGNAEIVVIDSKNNINMKFKIDKDTQFQSARGYGEYKLSSLWLLSEKEGLGGSLVSESLVKNMYLPIYLWKDGKKSNLNLTQKIKSFLSESKISSYEAVLTFDSIPSSVYINFTDSNLNTDDLKVEVQDLTGEIGTIDQVSKLIEVSGAKITSNTKGYDSNLDCEVSGDAFKLVDLMSKILNCKKIDSNNKGMILRLGAKFAERF